MLLAEKFVQLKAQDIEEKVNSAFRLVRWKLFDVQVNGGIKPCCEAMVDQYALDMATGKVPTTKPGVWVEYSTNLNTSARLNAGLDIIDVLSNKIGVSVPVFIDNSEGVQRLLPIQAQLIQTIVPLSYEKLGEIARNALTEKYGSAKVARTSYEAPNKQLRVEVRS